MSGSSVGGRRRRRRLRALLVSGVVVLAVGGVAAAALGFGGKAPEKPARSTMPPGTAKVTRTTLTETEDVAGTLGYGVATAVEGQASGKITWLPTPGSTVERGRPLYTVDDKPVVLLYGALPMYRTLAPGVDGRDVKQFEQNLAALGYRGFTVDESYSAATATAVKSWQEDLGLTRTGTVAPDAVAYAAGAFRVAELKGHVGGQASGAVLTYTGTTRQVSVALDLTKRGLATAGASVTVKLPGGATVTGAVASIGTVAKTQTGSDGKSETTTVDVVVSVADQTKVGSYDEAPVEVTFVASRHEDVLTVPILALLALAEGGYGVEVVDGGTTRIVPVQTGMFAAGRVEISGTGITTGTVVGVPK